MKKKRKNKIDLKKIHLIVSDWKTIAGWACVAFTGACLLATLFLFFIPWNVGENPKTLTVEKGMTPRYISILLREAAIIPNAKHFIFSVKLMGSSRKLQAGTYAFQGSVNHFSILRKFLKGEVVDTRLTVPEGMRASSMAELFERELGISVQSFMALVHDSGFCRSLDIEANSLEGYLYPDTYLFQKNSTAESVIRRMVSQFQLMFPDSLKQRAETLGMTVHQVVTLASIVEGEAVLDDERPVVAALYHNRLRKRMRLQADPTIQYIIPDGPRRLLTKDLQIESPYNTYLKRGLPPGPVNNPGIASILSTLYPSSDDYIYMVANGDGSHTFSKDMQEHLRAKARFDRLRRSMGNSGKR